MGATAIHATTLRRNISAIPKSAKSTKARRTCNFKRLPNFSCDEVTATAASAGSDLGLDRCTPRADARSGGADLWLPGRQGVPTRPEFLHSGTHLSRRNAVRKHRPARKLNAATGGA